MTLNTSKLINSVEQSITTQKVALKQEHDDMVAAVTGLKKELTEVLAAQREEIIRVRLELERIHEEEKRRRLAAIKRFESE